VIEGQGCLAEASRGRRRTPSHLAHLESFGQVSHPAHDSCDRVPTVARSTEVGRRSARRELRVASQCSSSNPGAERRFRYLAPAANIAYRPLSAAWPRNVDGGAMHGGEGPIFDWPWPTGGLGNQ
jgi:hypothetical protein